MITYVQTSPPEKNGNIITVLFVTPVFGNPGTDGTAKVVAWRHQTKGFKSLEDAQEWVSKTLANGKPVRFNPNGTVTPEEESKKAK